jgi:hypothetical protein
MNKLILGSLVSLALTSAAATVATAQSVNPAPQAAATQQRAQHHHGQRAFSRPTEQVEARLAFVKTALKINDAQTPQWNAFADTVRKQAVTREARMKEWREQAAQRGERAKPSAISRLEFEQKRHADAAARISERLAVEKPLYAALSQEQQAVADQVLVPRHHGKSGHHRGGHGRA